MCALEIGPLRPENEALFSDRLFVDLFVENFMEKFQTSACYRLFNRRTLSILLSLFFSLLLTSACTKSQPPGANETATSSAPQGTGTSTTTTTTTTTQPGVAPSPTASVQSGGDAPSNDADSKTTATAAATPPTLAEAQSSVARIYKNAVTVDTGRGSNPFIIGDFNDDGSQDIAVVVRPAKEMLSTLNGEYANWTVVDVTKVSLPVEHNGVAVLPPKPEPVKIEQGDQLLVIIHGYKQDGWRNAQAQQTYLLKNAVGENMRAQPVRYALAGASGKNPHVTVGGDVIKETRAKQDGFIYWTGAKYAWRQ
jgi:hypothetical protein